MKFKTYLKEDKVSAALDLPEPEVGAKYPDEKVKRYIETIDYGIKAMMKREESEANDAIMADLRDKKKKWQNVKKETKPTKTKLELPPDQDQEQNQEPPPEDNTPPPNRQQEENTILNLLKRRI